MYSYIFQILVKLTKSDNNQKNYRYGRKIIALLQICG